MTNGCKIKTKGIFYFLQDYQKSLDAEESAKLHESINFLEFTSSIVSFFHSSLPVKDVNDERLMIPRKCIAYLDSWHEDALQAPATPAEQNKMMLSDKTRFDLYSMLVGIEQICKYSFQEFPSSTLLLWRFNTNLVENIFCQQRGYHGQNDNPRYDQYQTGMNSILMGQKSATSKSNTGKVESLPFYRPKKLR